MNNNVAIPNPFEKPKVKKEQLKLPINDFEVNPVNQAPDVEVITFLNLYGCIFRLDPKVISRFHVFRLAAVDSDGWLSLYTHTPVYNDITNNWHPSKAGQSEAICKLEYNGNNKDSLVQISNANLTFAKYVNENKVNNSQNSAYNNILGIIENKLPPKFIPERDQGKVENNIGERFGCRDDKTSFEIHYSTKMTDNEETTFTINFGKKQSQLARCSLVDPNKKLPVPMYSPLGALMAAHLINYFTKFVTPGLTAAGTKAEPFDEKVFLRGVEMQSDLLLKEYNQEVLLNYLQDYTIDINYELSFKP